MERIPMTQVGFQQLEEEVKRLKTVDRPDVIQAIAEAREHGDLSENAEYEAARERQSFIEGRIAEIEDALLRADVIDITSLTGETVKFGATIKLIDEDSEEESSYKIVGTHEANIEKGLLSFTSPLARALIGKSVGDSVEVNSPGGSKSYEIIEVDFL